MRRRRGGLLGGGIKVVSIAIRIYWAEVTLLMDQRDVHVYRMEEKRLDRLSRYPMPLQHGSCRRNQGKT